MPAMVTVGVIPRIIVLALGAGALGGPEALRDLIALAGRSPAVDIAVCVFVIGMFTAQLLGAILLARFVCKGRPRPGGGAGRGAPAADPFAHVTLLVSLAVAVLVTASLLLACGGLGALRLPVDFATKNPIVTVLAIAAASLPYTMPPVRLFRGPRNVARGGAGAPAERATPGQTVRFVGLPVAVVACALLAIPLGDALRLSPGFSTTSVAFAVVAAVAGAVLHVGFTRRARNAAGAGGGAAPTAATDMRRFGRPASLAAVVFALACLLAAFLCAMPESGERAGRRGVRTLCFMSVSSDI